MANQRETFISEAKKLIDELKEYKDEYNSRKWKQIMELENLSKLEALQNIDYIINIVKSIERGQYLLMIGD